ncbi:hypothetical protein Sjap_019068 [Stephania japonica]|uniref:Uncharacterized protein n=1 Tax=Stephania japonica TaxID=461633 RepID=A0AAP0F6Z9_9MAGN
MSLLGHNLRKIVWYRDAWKIDPPSWLGEHNHGVPPNTSTSITGLNETTSYSTDYQGLDPNTNTSPFKPNISPHLDLTLSAGTRTDISTNKPPPTTTATILKST